MAHPIRPEKVMVTENFYSTTVYEKGAEVIRMIHTLLGEQCFRHGMDSYFEQFDGQVNIDISTYMHGHVPLRFDSHLYI